MTKAMAIMVAVICRTFSSSDRNIYNKFGIDYCNIDAIAYSNDYSNDYCVITVSDSELLVYYPLSLISTKSPFASARVFSSCRLASLLLARVRSSLPRYIIAHARGLFTHSESHVCVGIALPES
jgi:hypothetical protein